MAQFGIWQTRSVGFSKSRSAFFKKSGKVASFSTKAEAEAEAERLTAQEDGYRYYRAAPLVA